MLNWLPQPLLRCQVLQPSSCLSNPPLNSPVCKCVSCAGRLQTGRGVPDSVSQLLCRGKRSPFPPADSPFANAAHYAVGLYCLKGRLLIHTQLTLHQVSHASFSAELLPPLSVHGPYQCMGLLCPKSRTLIRFLSAHSSSFLRRLELLPLFSVTCGLAF